MTQNEIQQAVDILQPWHYNHVFAYGISTGESSVEAIHPKLAELIQVKAFPRPAYPRVLDLGANSGLIAMWFVDNKQSHVTAVEGNPKYYQQLELAIKLKGYDHNIKPLLQDLHDAQLEPNAYDLILFLGTLHHIKPDYHMRLLDACYQALMPAGDIVVQTDDKLPVEQMLKEVGFVAVRKLVGTSWHDRAAWYGLKDPMKLW